MASFTTVPEAVAVYERWLTCQPLSNNTRRTYLTQVHRYGEYLSTLHWEYVLFDLIRFVIPTHKFLACLLLIGL